MDEDLVLLIRGAEQVVGKHAETSIRFSNEKMGELEVRYPDGNRTYALKPLNELYAPDKGVTSVDMKDEHYRPLLVAIESEIVNHHKTDPTLTDGQVALTLSQLAMNPAVECGNDVLCRRIQLGLRLCLSLNDYSRQEVKLAIRKVAQSVDRHTKLAGPRGYLSFIRQFIP